MSKAKNDDSLIRLEHFHSLSSLVCYFKL